jgi:hypothetical protein
MYIWFSGQLLGPMPWWEVFLIRSKTRFFLVHVPDMGWRPAFSFRPMRAVDLTLTGGPPLKPPLTMRLRLQVARFVLRRLLALHHL